MSTMCSLSKKYLDKNSGKYVEYLDKPQYMCENCGRLANDSKNLCRPVYVGDSLETKNNRKTIKNLKKKIKRLKKKLNKN